MGAGMGGSAGVQAQGSLGPVCGGGKGQKLAQAIVRVRSVCLIPKPSGTQLLTCSSGVFPKRSR